MKAIPAHIEFKDYDFKIIEKESGPYVFDIVRKQYVALTPEEWVRQHLLHHFISDINYPASHMRVEMGLQVNRLSKRCDIIVYDKDLQPMILVECKSEKTKLTQKTFDQLSVYNMKFKVPFLVISNGHLTYCCKINYDNGSYEFLEGLPDYN